MKSVKRKKFRVRGTAERPRLAVYRSLENISAQVIDDTEGRTLALVTSIGNKAVKSGGNVEAAKIIGRQIAEKAREKGVKKVVFDRGGYIYHGRVKALSDAAREGGLQF
jgi:large subunit ribosomal protein L18